MLLTIASSETTFRQRMRIARERRGLSQEALAALTGVTVATISRIECGRRDPTIRTLRELARALDVSPGWLVGDAEPPIAYGRPLPSSRAERAGSGER